MHSWSWSFCPSYLLLAESLLIKFLSLTCSTRQSNIVQVLPVRNLDVLLRMSVGGLVSYAEILVGHKNCLS